MNDLPHRGRSAPIGWGAFAVVAGFALYGAAHLTHAQSDYLLLATAIALLGIWLLSRWLLRRRVAWLRTAMQRAGAGEYGVRLDLPAAPAWRAIAGAFNATMENLERDRALLLLRDTELKQRNAALLSLREALDSHAIVSVTSTAGDIVFVNDKFCRISGYSAEELLGQNHRLLKSGAHDDAFYQNLWSTIRAGRAWHGVIENRRKDGGHYWVQSSILPVLDSNGHPHQYISIRTDISSRERLRKGLEMLASAEHGEALFERIAQGLSIGLDARWTGFSRLCPDRATLELVACWDADAPGTTFRYALDGMPCQQALAQGDEFVVESDMRSQFPASLALISENAESYRGLAVTDHRGQPLGVLWALSERPAVADADEAALLAVAAKRAAAELSRLVVEGELREKDQRLEFVIEGAELAVWDWDITSGRIHINDRWATMLGYAPEEVPRHVDSWRRLLHPDDVPRIEAALGGHLAGDTPAFSEEVRLRARDGTWLWGLDSGRVTSRDGAGRALRASGIHFDINERKRAESDLIASEARFRVLVENVAVGIYLCDTAGHVVYANPPAERLYDMSAREAGGDGWLRRIHHDDVGAVTAMWRRLMEGRESHIEFEFRLVRGADDIRQVSARAHPVRVDGRLMGFVGSVEDVTERHVAALERDRLQSQLQQAQKMEALGQLTGGIAHDFNNILASILGYASLAHGRYATDNPKLAEYLTAVITAGERARDLIGKMLAFSRDTPRETGASMDVAALVREVTTLLASVIPSSITIAVDVANQVPRVQLGATDLHQVLVNLAVNARDAMGESGRLDIAVAATRRDHDVCVTCHEIIDGDYVEIVCRDTGSGMDEALMKRIFEPFFTTKDVGKGTGMGLAVVHGIVHRAGGHLLVDSTPGVGTAFHVLLPPAGGMQDDARGTVPGIPPRATRARSGRILVVDDEPMIAAYLKELLENEGHAVVTAHDGEAALALLRQSPDGFDLLITDQTMPRLSGTSLVKAAHALRADLPAVLCTGFSDTVSLRTARALGVQRFLRKPVESESMLRVVAELLDAGPVPQLTARALPSQ